MATSVNPSSPASLAVKLSAMDPFEDHSTSSPQFAPVAFTLKSPGDFDTWYYVAKATAGETLWPSIDPVSHTPCRPLLEEPPLPTLNTVKPGISPQSGVEDLTEKELLVLQCYWEEWKDKYYKYLRQETQLYHFNLWLFRSISPQYWSCFKRENTVHEKMLAIKNTLDLGPRSRWFRPKKSAPIQPVPVSKVRAARPDQKLAGCGEIKKIVDSILEHGSMAPVSGARTEPENVVRKQKDVPDSKYKTDSIGVAKVDESAAPDPKKAVGGAAGSRKRVQLPERIKLGDRKKSCNTPSPRASNGTSNAKKTPTMTSAFLN